VIEKTYRLIECNEHGIVKRTNASLLLVVRLARVEPVRSPSIVRAGRASLEQWIRELCVEHYFHGMEHR
jgi:hypothetical protein